MQVAYHKLIKYQDFALTQKLHKTAPPLRSGAAALLCPLQMQGKARVTTQHIFFQLCVWTQYVGVHPMPGLRDTFFRGVV